VDLAVAPGKDLMRTNQDAHAAIGAQFPIEEERVFLIHVLHDQTPIARAIANATMSKTAGANIQAITGT
jgi:hypothetical protein